MWENWTHQIAAKLNRTVDEVDALSERSFMAVLTQLHDDAERCPSCRLSDSAKWHVKAEMHRCPACEDRDVVAENLPKRRAGLLVRFGLVDWDDRETESSAALFTAEHRHRLHALRRERR